MWKFDIVGRYSLTLKCGLVLVSIFYASSAQPVAECPNKGSVIVSQNALAPRAASQVTLTCDFRVPSGQLLYLSWSIHELNTKVYGYNPVHDPPDIIENHEKVVSASSDVNETIGHSELVINTEVKDVCQYKCVAYLLDYSYCFDSKQIEFEPPELEIQADGKTICRNDDVPCYPYTAIHKGRHVISGYVTNCHRDHVLILSARGVNVTRNDIGSNGQMYDRAFISATTNFSSDDEVSFTLIEKGRPYHLQYPQPVTDCTNGGSVAVSQRELVQRPSGQVTLACDIVMPSRLPIQLFWSVHDTHTAIYSYIPANKSPSNTHRPDIVSNSSNGTVTRHSEIVINTTVNDTLIYRCDVFSETDIHCFDFMQIDFEAPALEIRADGRTICSSIIEPCCPDTLLLEGSHLISGHANICQPDPIIYLTVNGQPIAAAAANVTYNQGHCQTYVSAVVELTSGDIIAFALVDRGKISLLHCPYPGEPDLSQLHVPNKTSFIYWLALALATLIAIIICMALIKYIMELREQIGTMKRMHNSCSVSSV